MNRASPQTRNSGVYTFRFLGTDYLKMASGAFGKPWPEKISSVLNVTMRFIFLLLENS